MAKDDPTGLWPRLGATCEVLDGDHPNPHVFQGHPGRVTAVYEHDPNEVEVTLVGGPTVGALLEAVRPIAESVYRSRGERIIAGLHPLEDRRIGPPITAPEGHWE